jgi:hypothetical protein
VGSLTKSSSSSSPPACARSEAAEIGWAWAARVEGKLLRHRVAVAGGFAAICLLGAVLLPRIAFDFIDDRIQSSRGVRPHRSSSEVLQLWLSKNCTVSI